MSSLAVQRRPSVANAVYELLDPIPFGFFVAALVFDIIFLRTGVVMWGKSAAWLITIGLLFAVIPRLINLVQVWITSRQVSNRRDRFDFWLNLVAIVVASFNAFVHSRDAYASMPTGVWLSVLTVALLAVAHLVMATQQRASTVEVLP